jgi:phospholipase C
VVSPWSRGGWVNSQVFDHTSAIRFLETRFGVHEPNISPWRRAVCGDLTSAFDFKAPNRKAAPARLPPTAETAARAAGLPHVRPPTPAEPAPPVQAAGVRPSRALPYALEASLAGDRLAFANQGRTGAVFHVYELTDLAAVPRRYTVAAGKTLIAPGGRDLWVLGPNGFHRRFRGHGGPTVTAHQDRAGALTLSFHNPTARPMAVAVAPNAYVKACLPQRLRLKPGATAKKTWALGKSGGWYDLAVTVAGDADFLQRYAGRVETGRPSISDPEMGGAAVMSWA